MKNHQFNFVRNPQIQFITYSCSTPLQSLIMPILLDLLSFIIPIDCGYGSSSSISQSKPKDNTLFWLGVSLVLIPGIPITALVAAVGSITFAGCYSVYLLASFAAQAVVTTVLAAKYVITQPVYFICSPFFKSQEKIKIPQDLKDKVVTVQQVNDFKNMVMEEIKKDSSKTYIVVKEFSHAESSLKSKEKVLNTMAIVLQSEDTVATVLILCKKKWVIRHTQSLQILCKNSLILLGTPLKNLQRNEMGVVELSLITMQTFG